MIPSGVTEALNTFAVLRYCALPMSAVAYQVGAIASTVGAKPTPFSRQGVTPSKQERAQHPVELFGDD